MRVTSKPLSLSRRAASSSLARSGFSLSVGLTLIVAETSIRLSLFPPRPGRRNDGRPRRDFRWNRAARKMVPRSDLRKGRRGIDQPMADRHVRVPDRRKPLRVVALLHPNARALQDLADILVGEHAVLASGLFHHQRDHARDLRRRAAGAARADPAVVLGRLVLVRESLAAEAVVQLAIRRARHHDVDCERLLPAQSAY